MTAYVPVGVTRGAGVDMTAGFVTVGGTTGDTFPASPDNYLRVKNTSASAVTVSVINAGANAGPSGTFLAPLALSPAVAITTGDRMFGPFPAATFADPSDGQVHVAYSSAGATVSAVVYNTSAQ